MRLRKCGNSHILAIERGATLDRKRQFKKDFASRVVLLKTRRTLYCLVIKKQNFMVDLAYNIEFMSNEYRNVTENEQFFFHFQ